MRHGRPHIERRARGLDVPAKLVERLGDQPVPAEVDGVGCMRLLLPTVQRLDRRPLHGLEDAGVDVRLQLPDESNEISAATDPTDPPAGHVVGLREGVEFEADLLGARNLE